MGGICSCCRRGATVAWRPLIWTPPALRLLRQWSTTTSKAEKSGKKCKLEKKKNILFEHYYVRLSQREVTELQNSLENKRPAPLPPEAHPTTSEFTHSSSSQKLKHERHYLLYCLGIGTPALDAALDQYRLSESSWVSADCGQPQVRSPYVAEHQGRLPSSHSTELCLHLLQKRKRKPNCFIIHQMLECHCLLNTKFGVCTQLPL